MNRRRFLGTLGGASGSALAGCADVELVQDDTPGAPDERVRFLERQRAVLLYTGGVTFVAEGETARRNARTAAKSAMGPAARALSLGRASGYYDAAAWNFARAAGVLAALDLLGVDLGASACRDARTRAFHLGMGSVYRARALVESAGGDLPTAAPSSAIYQDSDGMRPAGTTTTTTSDDGMEPAGTTTTTSDGMEPAGTTTTTESGMQPAGTTTTATTDDLSVEGDTPKELAAAHFARAREYEIVTVEQLREGLGLTGG